MGTAPLPAQAGGAGACHAHSFFLVAHVKAAAGSDCSTLAKQLHVMLDACVPGVPAPSCSTSSGGDVPLLYGGSKCGAIAAAMNAALTE